MHLPWIVKNQLRDFHQHAVAEVEPIHGSFAMNELLEDYMMVGISIQRRKRYDLRIVHWIVMEIPRREQPPLRRNLRDTSFAIRRGPHGLRGRPEQRHDV